MADQEEDFSSLPLPDRFQHKVWKVRKAAYEDAAKQFEVTADEYDPVFKPFIQDPGLWKGAVADSNVAAQQEGIAALCAFLKFGGKEHCIRSRSHTVTSLVEKGLSSTRAATKASSLEALLLYIELDTAAPLIDDLIPSLSHKQPKIVAATLSALTAIYHNFGCKIVDPKPALKTLPKAFGHADKNVRAEATKLAVEFYRWLREAMKPMFWADLKSTQQTDMESLFEKIKTEPVPRQERLLRSQQAALERAPPGESGAAEPEQEAEEEAEIDVFAMLEPQDVLSKVPPNFSEQIASSKWKDRKEALEAIYKVLDVPKIKDGDFGDIVRELAKCMKDANIAVVTQAAQCIEVLAKGLRKPFGKYRSIVVDPIMERMKEKKASVSDALGAAMDQVFLATSLSENLEETIAKLQHKNPQVKEATVKFLIRCLRTTKEAPSKQEVASIAEAAKKLLAEPSEVLRLGGAEALGTVMKIMGERAMGPYMEGLDENKKTKIKEYFSTAEVKAKDKPKPPPVAVARPPPAAAPRKVVAKKATVKKPAPPPSIYAQEAPSASQVAGRGAASTKTSGSKASGLTNTGLKGPTKRIPAGVGASLPSPRRATAQAPPTQEEALPTPRIGLSRGLAGRSLTAKPPAAIATPSNPISPALDSEWSAAEKTELEELRRDKDRLLRQNDELRQEKSRLNSEIQELKNETAQLIENRARDSLSIMAKETQLVRTRSECEAAEAMCGQLRREMERLKRALTSAERVNSPTALSPSRDGMGEDGHAYRETGIFGNVSDNRQAYNRSRLSYTSTLSEEKENGDLLSPPFHSQVSMDLSRNSRSAGPRGRSSPALHPSHQTTRLSRDTSVDNSRPETGQGLESWKRAAEVTSALKAKIEHMKARQGISSRHSGGRRPHPPPTRPRILTTPTAHDAREESRRHDDAQGDPPAAAAAPPRAARRRRREESVSGHDELGPDVLGFERLQCHRLPESRNPAAHVYGFSETHQAEEEHDQLSSLAHVTQLAGTQKEKIGALSIILSVTECSRDGVFVLR
ncbi:Spindle pole body component [Podosphaera aphanis]|nr:Spindle pole body component [Podosphaera aphanis]